MTGFEGSVPSAPRHSYGPLLCTAAAVLTLVGSFQITFSVVVQLPFQDGGPRFTVTSWGVRDDRDGGFGLLGETTAVNGVPLTVAAVVLLIAAVLGLRIAPWAGNARVMRATGPVALVGTAFLAGTVFTIGMQVLGMLNAWTQALPPEADIQVDAGIGTGFWMLVAAVAVAVAAAVLSWRRGGVDAVREEPDTPVLGIPVVIRLPDEPQPDR